MSVNKNPLGTDLRTTRLEKNITLQKVAEDTHISSRHLQSLEEGRYGELPGGMYNRAFLRAYCVYLGLRPEEFVARYEREAMPLQGAAKNKAREVDIPSAPVRVNPLLVWSLMLIASIAGLYFSRGWITNVFSPYLRPQPPPLPGAAPPEQNLRPKTEIANPAAAIPTPSVPAQPQPEAAVPPEPAPGTIRLQFSGLQECWLSVTGDGQRVFSRVLQPGEEQTFEAKNRFELVLGNAGGVSLKINGDSAKPLGGPGTVARISIDEKTIPALLVKNE